MLFIALGLLVGTIGSVVGVGGGFFLVPIIIFLRPDFTTSEVVAMSLVVVAFNATAGALFNLKQQRIDKAIAKAIAFTSLPGLIVGVYVASIIERAQFVKIFGGVLLLYSFYLFFRSWAKAQTPESKAPAGSGEVKTFWHATVGVGAGFLSSFLGIGGGIVYVPYISQMAKRPVHVAVATSQAIMVFTSWATVFMRIGTIGTSYLTSQLLMLIIGVIAGARVGVWSANKLSPKAILRILTILMFIVSIRLLMSAA